MGNYTFSFAISHVTPIPCKLTENRCKKKLVKKWGCFATKTPSPKVDKIIIFLGQKFKSWQPRSSSSLVEAGFHVIVLVVSITRVVLNVFRRSRPSYGNASNERETIAAMGPLQLNGRVRQNRLAREYGRQWGKKKTRLHHLKCDFPSFQVDTTARLSLVQGVLYHVTVKMPSANWSDRASKGPLGWSK